MADESDNNNILLPNTPIRKLRTPSIGDSYLDTYVSLIKTFDRKSVYRSQTQEGLPSADIVSDPLFGVAESEFENIDTKAAHTNMDNKWNGTMGKVAETWDYVELDVDDYDNISDMVDSVSFSHILHGHINRTYDLRDAVDNVDVSTVRSKVTEIQNKIKPPEMHVAALNVPTTIKPGNTADIEVIIANTGHKEARNETVT